MPICCQAAACADTTTNAAHPRGARPIRLKPGNRDDGELAVVAVMARRGTPLRTRQDALSAPPRSHPQAMDGIISTLDNVDFEVVTPDEVRQCCDGLGRRGRPIASFGALAGEPSGTSSWAADYPRYGRTPDMCEYPPLTNGFISGRLDRLGNAHDRFGIEELKALDHADTDHDRLGRYCFCFCCFS